MVNNQTPYAIRKLITDYEYIHNVIDYDYIISGNGDYEYLRSCNQLQSVMITINPCPLMITYKFGLDLYLYVTFLYPAKERAIELWINSRLSRVQSEV